MGEKAFASLTSGLLARKGQARPAMRPQGFSMGIGNPEDLGWNDMGYQETAQELPRSTGPRLPASLATAPSVTPPEIVANAEVPEVVRQQQDIEREFSNAEVVEPVAPVVAVVAEPETAGMPASRAKRPVRRPAKRVAAHRPAETSFLGDSLSDARRKAAFTLRLDAERHLRLRLACAVQNRSAQQFVTEALDRLLDSLPDVERLAASLPDPVANA